MFWLWIPFVVDILLLVLIFERLTHMATQADVDALTTAVNAFIDTVQTETTELAAADAAILAEIANLQSANPALDLTALTDAVGRGSTAVANLQAAADTVEAIPPVA